MRKTEYLSPSRIALFKKDQEQFYIRYLAEKRLPDDQQTLPMSVGSSFDAYAKSYLHEKLFGKGNDPRFEFQALFEAQVEPHCRDQAINDGKYVFEMYKQSGALSDLLLDLQQAIGKPRFEVEVKGVIDGYREGVSKTISGVTFLGKPDLFYINRFGCQITIDWKVNGFYAPRKTSPKKGYVRLLAPTVVNSTTLGPGVPCHYRNMGSHKECVLKTHNGVLINAAITLDKMDADWATQLSIYSWLLGCEIGEQFVVGIDQCACSAVGGLYPEIRFAEHRMLIDKQFQYDTFALAQDIWDRVHSDHFFREMSKEDSQARCSILDKQAEGFKIENEQDRLFYEITKPPKRAW